MRKTEKSSCRLGIEDGASYISIYGVTRDGRPEILNELHNVATFVNPGSQSGSLISGGSDHRST